METYVGAFEAKTHLSSLLERVANGEKIIITEHGKPIAKLVPIDPAQPPDIKLVVAEMLSYRDEMQRTLDGISIRELAEEGRR